MVRSACSWAAVSIVLLGPRLVVRQLEDLRDPFADLFVCWPAGERLLARGGELAAHVLGLVEGPGESLLELPDLAVPACYEVVNLTAAIAAHLHFELFMQQVRQEITVFIHGITRILCPERSAGTMSGV
jgi:hypothetical protein